jgi:ubiquinone/menaquinone biosynthesis C-methylase UbiE
MEYELSSEILAYYQQAPEHERLQVGASQLEFVRTKEVIGRWIGDRPAVVVDVGGGPGAYAAWLSDLGHEVHLVDPVPRLVDQARTLRGATGRQIASCAIGDARSLERDDRSADVVLLLGPLYHLIEAGERLRALKEAHRVLVPGGLLFTAAISRFASALDGLARDLFVDPLFGQIVQRDLAEGIHENITGKLDYFTTAQFHRPEELEAEVTAAGFSIVSVVGLEGPGWLFADFEERWGDSRRREDLLRIARALEAERSIQSVSAHLLAVARREAAQSAGRAAEPL